MKKSVEITAHLSLWTFFTLFVVVLCKIYLEAKSDAPFAQHLTYVVFLELIMGLIFFYTTFLAIPWASKQKRNTVILLVILVILLLVFAFPAMQSGIWQVMSSIVPHIMLILLALVFRKLSRSPELPR